MKKKQIRSRQQQVNTPADQKGKPTQGSRVAIPEQANSLKTPLGILITVFAFILYAQSISHDYTLDDHKVIDENTVTKKGVAGIPTIFKTDYWYGSGQDELRGPVYRPVPLIIFATVWEFFPNSPRAYHFILVLFYALRCVVLFLLLCKIFNKQGPLLPFVCSLLYVAHPIHTEVVNNIKSLDEILCFFFALVSIWF